ncbi:MAG TPA: glycosyltransferase [Candidatus Paceibacterota bacterium]|nr:glycosyltransferase [Candidatus Paceibacterota bacterium]
MKITFFVSGSILSNFSYRTLALARSLHKLGHDVSIVAPRADKYNNFTPEMIKEVDGVRIIQPFQFATRRLEINLIPYLFGAVRALFRERPDLIYIYKATPISIVGLLGKLFWKTPVVTDFDDLGSEVMKIEGHPFHQRKLVEWSERIAGSYADRLVAASRYLFDYYHRKYPETPIYLMQNGVDKEWFAGPLVPSTQRTIVFFGAINRTSILEPLFDVLPNVAREVPGIKAVIIGDGKFLPYFKEKTIAANLGNIVTFTGWLDFAAARTYLQAGSIGYSYMPRENTAIAASSMKISQYMSRGVIPLVSDINDMANDEEFLSAAYVVPTGDRIALESSIKNLFKNDDIHARSKNARQFSATHFDWDALASGFSQWIYPTHTHTSPKVYIVTTKIPGDVGGSEIRNYNLIRQLLKSANVHIEVFCIAQNDPQSECDAFESRIGAQCHAVHNTHPSIESTIRGLLWGRVPPFMENFKASGIGDIFRKACERSLPDFVQVEKLDAYYCIRPHISWLKQQGVKIIFDCHNIEFQNFHDSLRLFSWPKRMIGKYLTPALKRLELEGVRNAHAVLACSESDADFFRQYNPNTHVIPNGVDCSSFAPATTPTEPTLIFMGGTAYPPNADAMEFYLKSIHPLVRRVMPATRFLAIGVTAQWLESEGIDDPSVQPLGFVDDVRPFLRRATVGICPVRYGSGTRIKIMTYMAAGLPVVATDKGAEGVPYVDGRNILLANDPETFAKNVVALLRDRHMHDEIAKNGTDFIRKNYDWDVIGKTLRLIYN